MKKKFILLFLVISLSLNANDLKISVDTNYKNFKPGQSIKVEVQLQATSYLYLLVLKTDGKIHLLYPNAEEFDNLILEDAVSLPSPTKNYEFIAGETYGMDTIFAIASRNRIQKLQQEKYYSTALYKNIKVGNWNWIKKIGANSHPDQWTFAETKIFISKDGISESTKTIVKKDTKEKNLESKKSLFYYKSEKQFLAEEFMTGNFKLPETQSLLSGKGKFTVSKREDSFSLKIFPHRENLNQFCEYKIKSNLKPDLEKKIFGNIDAEITYCKLEELSLEEQNLWSAFRNIFLHYNYKDSKKITGNLWFISANDKFNSKLSKTDTRNPF